AVGTRGQRHTPQWNLRKEIFDGHHDDDTRLECLTLTEHWRTAFPNLRTY
ncbi:unnamed protein product, partial [Mesorhabditis spiculigera]